MADKKTAGKQKKPAEGKTSGGKKTASENEVSTNAKFSLIFGIIGLIIFAMVFGLLAIIFGALGLNDPKKSKKGKTWATIGLALGIVDIISWILIVGMFFR